jgi:hypothetical protein
MPNEENKNMHMQHRFARSFAGVLLALATTALPHAQGAGQAATHKAA